MTEPVRSAERSARVQSLLRRRLEERAAKTEETETIPRRVAGPAPLSFAQERLWFLDRLEPGNPTYNIPVALRLRGRLDPGVLAASLDEVIRRHEILRTRVGVVDGEAVQVVAPALRLALPLVDLLGLPHHPHHSHPPHDIARQEAVRLASREARALFDLERGPLVRATLLALGAGEHILLLTLHHAIADGWSMRILIRELALLYEAFSAARPSPLPELPIQYGDFAAWQRGWLQGEVLAGQLAWWRDALASASGVLDLPADRPRPPVMTSRGGEHALVLPPELLARLHAFSREADATLFMALLLAYQALLGRYSGQEDVLVGTPIANRNRIETEPLIGFFANTLVMRGDLAGGVTFRQALARVREVCLGAFAHQDLPFERLVAELRPGRDLARPPLFQAMFVLQNRGTGAPRSGPLAFELFEVPAGVAKFELTLSLSEGDQGLSAGLEYNRDLFEPATAARIAAHFARLLEGAVADPGRRVLDLPLLSPWERQQIVTEWGAREAAAGADESLHGLFEQAADRTPGAVAAVHEVHALSYGQLDRRANQLARFLVSSGVRPGDRVALCLERSLDMVAAILAVLKAGAAYVPLEPAHPAERTAFMLADAGVTLLVSERAVVIPLPESPGVPVVLLDAERERIGREPGERLRIPVAPGDWAYVIYTSGSTGKPKGVGVTHANVARLFRATAPWFGFGPDDVWTLFHSYAFDFSVWEIWGALLHGGRLVVVPYLTSRSPEAFHNLLVTERVTVLNQTPSAFRQLIAAEPSAEALALRWVIFGGEALELRSLAPWFARHGRHGRHGDTRPRLVNMYGITETTVHVTFRVIRQEDLATARGSVVGRPIPDLSVHLLDPAGQPVPLGVAGEIHVGGAGVAAGYLGRPELTAARFVPDPLAAEPGARLYRSGDLARFLPDGDIEYLGRIDHQVKVRGFRVELQEIEAVLAAHPAVREALVVPWEQALAAYVVPWEEADAFDRGELREALRKALPEYMVPASFTVLPAFPLTPNGKLDRGALPPPERPKTDTTARPRNDVERTIAAIWCEVLSLPEVPVTESFFDLGGHSLLVVRVERLIRERLGREVPLIELFRYPTVETLAGFLSGRLAGGQPVSRTDSAAAPAGVSDISDTAIAIVGMAGRFPGAASVEELWRRLCRGDELITFFPDEELRAAGVPAEALADPRYVPARGVLEGCDRFAASFFDVSPREAQLMDPQQRIFLECAWEALEDAALDPSRFPGRIAVVGGGSESSYVRNLQANPAAVRAVGGFQAALLNRNDFLTARVSYKLDLKGPSLNVQTACSTSLVAVHLACRSLLEGECEAALAGGVSISGARRGYLYEAGGIASPDGHTRTFSARARGTIAGEGVGIVVLKRLADALEAGDRVYAVLRATAINNDGGQKIGFTAPGIEGQATVIAAAQKAAGVDPGSLGYVEAHGTATELGDPIEMAALTQAFRARTDRTGFCAIGSIKSNLGHLDAAAGVAGLIKAALAVDRGEIPPSLHFDEPNPGIDFASSPFYVQTALTSWSSGNGPSGNRPRRAAVSSFGIGGTNAHAILEQAPPGLETGPSRRLHLLPVSARTPAALDAACARLADHLELHPDLDLADTAWTLQTGRRAFAHRRIVVAGGREEAVSQLREPGIAGIASRPGRPGRTVFFLFPGQGSQHAGMAAELYEEEPVFREHFDRCLGLLDPELAAGLRAALKDGDGLLDTSLAQPALFAVEYALARLWMSWGIAPAGFLGHSIGEYVAACLAGVFTLEQALSIVAARGRLMQQLPEGAMLAVSCPEEAAPSLTARGLALAAVNGPGALVVSGPAAAIEELERDLAASATESRRLFTRRAFHSAMTEPVLETFARKVGEHALAAPRIRFVSNLTGAWIAGAEATDPNYWARHLRETVRFGDGIRTLLEEPEAVLLEVGPRRTLSALARRQAESVPGSTVLSSLPTPGEPLGEVATLLTALGRLWLTGAEVDWAGFNAPGRRRRVPLPAYPFERGSYWLEAAGAPKRAEPEPPATPATPATPAILGPAAPGSEVERRIAAIWRDILGVARIEPHDNFFELGGSSLLAVRLGAHLRRELGIEISPHLLLAHPTLGGFALAAASEPAVAERKPGAAAAADTAAPETSGFLVAVQPLGRRPPLFLVHPAGGHVYLFRELGQELGDDQPLYGLRAPGLEPGESPAASVEKMAERYLAEIRAFRPAGPYLLGGSSMGGMIAYEMAQRLAAAGEDVALLALFDTFGPGQLPERATEDDLVRREVERPRSGGGGPLAGVDPEQRRRLLAVIQANVGAMYAYEPGPYPGKLVFFRAEARGGDPPHPERPWIELARGGTEIYPVPGNHVSLHARPHVGTVAGRLARCIDAALRM
jgi:amino acid adenylation domain-containing protein